MFRKKRIERDGGASGYLWERSQAGMCTLFRLLVLEVLEKAKHDTEVAVRPHQVKKLSVSLCGKYWSKARDLRICLINK